MQRRIFKKLQQFKDFLLLKFSGRQMFLALFLRVAGAAHGAIGTPASTGGFPLFLLRIMPAMMAATTAISTAHIMMVAIFSEIHATGFLDIHNDIAADGVDNRDGSAHNKTEGFKVRFDLLLPADFLDYIFFSYNIFAGSPTASSRVAIQLVA